MKTGSGKYLLDALNGDTSIHPRGGRPMWMMRQAGRYLPEYRALRADKGGFLDLVYDSEAAAEVTLQRANLHNHSVTAVTMIMPMITHLQAESPKDAVSTILPKFSFQRTTKRAEEDTSN